MNATPTTQPLPSVQIDASSALTLESAMRAGFRIQTSGWCSKMVGRHDTMLGAFGAAFAAVSEEIDGLEESSPRTLDVLSGPC